MEKNRQIIWHIAIGLVALLVVCSFGPRSFAGYHTGMLGVWQRIGESKARWEADFLEIYWNDHATPRAQRDGHHAYFLCISPVKYRSVVGGTKTIDSRASSRSQSRFVLEGQYPVWASLGGTQLLWPGHKGDWELIYDESDDVLIVSFTRSRYDQPVQWAFGRVRYGVPCPGWQSAPPRTHPGDPGQRSSSRDSSPSRGDRAGEDTSPPSTASGPSVVTFFNRTGVTMNIFYAIVSPGGTVDCRYMQNDGHLRPNESVTYSVEAGRAGYFNFRTCPYPCNADCPSTDFSANNKDIAIQVRGGTGVSETQDLW